MPSVISVNVGLPRDIAWQGKLVHTAVWKRTVTGRVMARRLNLDGDGQGDLAGHGGEHRAVMVYQIDSYRYWETYLQRHDFEYGQFGENLTIDGLPDNEVRIGDRYRIGGALFEITQPRVTCYRVGIRMGNPAMPALLVSHRRPGFYFRVLEEGEIGTGDEIVKVTKGPEHVTVEEIDGLLYLPGHTTDRLQRALRIPALSEGWKGSLRSLIAAEEKHEKNGNAALTPSTAPPPLWRGFRSLRVAAIQRECADVLSFVLESEDQSALPAPLPGQFLVLRIPLDKGSDPILRNYSISGAPPGGKYRISVKRAAGAGSRHLHDEVRVGDLLQVSAPRGSFTLTPDNRPVVLLSAGIGATPVLSMLRSLADDSANPTREVWWCYGARTGTEHPFAAEVRGLLSSLPQSHSVVAYSRPADEDQVGRDYDFAGHLNLAFLRERGLPRDADFYLCGPPALLAGFAADLRSWGVPGSCVHSEVFGTEPSITPGIASSTQVPPHAPGTRIAAGPKVSFTRSGLTVPWDSRYGSLLELAEACDIPVRWSCRMGVCHTCECGLIDGGIRYTFEPLDPPAEGNVLPCCSVPVTGVQLDL